MALKEELKIVINGDASGAMRAFGDVGKSASGMGKSLANFVKVGAVAALAAVTAAAAGTAAIMKKAFENWSENQLIQTKLNNTLKNTGKLTGVTADLVNKLGKELQKTTRFEDDMVASGGEILARFKNINSNIFPETIQLTADLAESLGIDFPEAAKMMGKALSTPGEGLRVLKQAGVDLGDDVLASIDRLLASGKLEEAQKLILSALSGSVGGVAVEAGKTSSGLTDRIKNQIDGIFDGVAESLGPGFDKVLDFISTSLDQFTSDPETIAFIDNLGVTFEKMATNLPQAVGSLREFMTILSLPPSEGPGMLFESIGKFSEEWMNSKLVSQMISDITNVGQAILHLNQFINVLGQYLTIQLLKAFDAFLKSKFVSGVRGAFAGIAAAIDGITRAIKDVIKWFAELPAAIPPWLIPGSPTPFEIGLRGISSELDNISKATMPNLTGGVSASMGGADNGAASEMAGIRDEIRFLVRTLPRAIANANA